MIHKLTDPTPIREQPTTEDVLDSMVEMIAALRDAVRRDRMAREARDAAILDRLHEVTNQGPQWMTALEAAEYLRVSKPTLYSYVNLGHITRYKVEGRALFRRDEIDAFIEQPHSHD